MGSSSRRKRDRRAIALAAGKTPLPKQTNEPIIEGDRSVRVRGSDQKSLVIRECKLCGATRRLLLGHVAPRWAALWTRNEGYVLGSYGSLGVETKTQDYPKHYFFCSECEQRLGRAEEYLSRLTRGTITDLSKIGASVSLNHDQPELSGVDYVLLMRALTGVALKVHLSAHELYRKWSLSRSEATALVRAILSDQYPESRFALHAEKFSNRVIPGANPRSALYLYFVRRHGGLMAKLTMAGMTWGLFIGPADRVRQEFREASMPLMLERGRPWPIVPSEVAADPTLMGGAPVPIGKLRKADLIDPADPCPCGLTEAFGNCCAGRWLPRASHSLVFDPKA